MIRRCSKHCDLKDYIKSCPSGVIDDIYEIRYYIQGHPEYITASFSKVGEQLVAVLPTSQLETLPNGILMRRAFYKVIDTSYPDGYYNLEFEDNMNIWLGDYESEEPIIPEYVTEEELSSTLSSYATEDWVESQQFVTEDWVQAQGYLTSENIPSGIATQSWVLSQSYITSLALDGYATQSWVQNQGYLTSHQDLSSYATQSWVSSNFLSSGALEGYATVAWVSYTIDNNDQNPCVRADALDRILEMEDYASKSWVEAQGYLTSNNIPSGIATQSWVSSNFLSSGALEGYATQTWVQNQGYLTSHQDLSSYATQSWVSSNFLSSGALSGYATQSWVQNQGFASEEFVTGQGYVTLQDIDANGYITESLVSDMLLPYATQSWVNVNFLSSTALSGYATQSWVQSQGYLTSVPSQYATESWVDNLATQYINQTSDWVLSTVIPQYTSALSSQFGYATQSWVSSNFLSATALNGYATQSWVSSNFLSSGALSGYATQSWVESSLSSYAFKTDFYTSEEVDILLSSYATKSWVASNYFEESKIWTGPMSEWEGLTSEQKAFYTIALVTE